MINPQEFKQKLGENTEKLETQVAEYYFQLEPWQRGASVISLIILLMLIIYWLIKEDKSEIKKRKAEEIQEERLIKKLQLLKDLRN